MFQQRSESTFADSVHGTFGSTGSAVQTGIGNGINITGFDSFGGTLGSTSAASGTFLGINNVHETPPFWSFEDRMNIP
jgi:hypothetical protein